MQFSKIFFASLFASIAAVAGAALPRNALEAVESQRDLSFFASLIKRDPVLAKLYTTAKDVTVFAPTNVAFKGFTIDEYPFSDIGITRESVQFLMVEGQYPLDAITPKPKYVASKLTNATYVNLSRGNQPVKLADIDGKKTAFFGSGSGAPISNGNLKFQGGILHKILTQIAPVFDIKGLSIVDPVNFYAFTNLSAYGLLDKLDKTKDVTLFTITNPAWEKLIIQKICLPSLKSIPDILEYYAIVGNVYYGDSFTGRSVKTLSGETVTLKGYPTNSFTVNGVKVALSDITVVNGVIHALESPIFPPNDKPTFPSA